MRAVNIILMLVFFAAGYFGAREYGGNGYEDAKLLCALFGGLAAVLFQLTWIANKPAHTHLHVKEKR